MCYIKYEWRATCSRPSLRWLVRPDTTSSSIRPTDRPHDRILTLRQRPESTSSRLAQALDITLPPSVHQRQISFTMRQLQAADDDLNKRQVVIKTRQPMMHSRRATREKRPFTLVQGLIRSLCPASRRGGGEYACVVRCNDSSSNQPGPHWQTCRSYRFPDIQERRGVGAIHPDLIFFLPSQKPQRSNMVGA